MEMPLPGSAINFRPLAAARLVPGAYLFRTGDLSWLSAGDGKLLKETLQLKLYLDLRSRREQKLFPPVELIRAGVEWYPLPMQGVDDTFRAIRRPEPSDYTELYLRMLEHDRQPIGSCLAMLAARPVGSIVYGCQVGKDRTGVIAAIILGLLGAASQDIATDYQLSNTLLRGSIDHFRRHWKSKGLTQDEYVVRIACNLEIMFNFCAEVEEHYGSWVSCAKSLGLSEDDICQLRCNFCPLSVNARDTHEGIATHSALHSELL